MSKQSDKTRMLLYGLGALSLVIFAMLVFGLAREQQNTSRLQVALCLQRTQAARNENNAIAFLKENPNGIPGITASLIQREIANDRQDLAALRGVKCP